jgi:adenosylcobinamide kinase/adenosylcobinamide-phosphate guanylyltransferase
MAAEYRRRAFLATAQAMDGEMRDRIARHQSDRGPSFVTIEEPWDPARAIRELPVGFDVVLVDCLTVWLGNLFHRYGGESDSFAEVESLNELLKNPPCDVILVTNEVGLGIIPDNALARRFRDTAGFLNQQVARAADEVILLVSGIPLIIKEKKVMT